MHYKSKLAVVLGGGLNPDGTPNEATLLRAHSAAKLAIARPDMQFILSGGSAVSDNVTTGACEAEIMARIFEEHGVSRDRLLIEDQSRDTLGNAVLVTARYLRHRQPGSLLIISSPFHASRALLVFCAVLGSGWNLEFHGSTVGETDAQRGANEKGGIEWTHNFFRQLSFGDLKSITQRLLEVREVYKGNQYLAEVLAASPAFDESEPSPCANAA